MSFLFGFFALLFGLILGSFLNVCIYRIPRKQSVIVPRSYCPQCGRFIRWFDNIPIFSYGWLQGRCRSCRRHIPFRYPLVEAITGVLSALTYAKFGLGWTYASYFLFLVAPLIVITFIDLEHQIIPDIITLPGLVVGLFTTLTLSGLSPINAFLKSFWGILAGGGTLFVISWIYERLRHREGIGGGDVKLAAMLGAFFGWKAVFVTLLLGSFFGSLTGLILMIIRRQGAQTAVPFGPFLAAGALAYLFFGAELLEWYARAIHNLY